ncbi:MAG: hypothetical protein R3Y54_00855 [Eubacteriales bacterium]
MSTYLTHQIITILIIVFLVLSMLYQIIIGLLYQNMMKEAENMSSTKHKLLNQCKIQFSTYYQLHNGHINTPIYVERFLSKMKIGKIKIGSLSHISGQLLLLSIFFAGIGICKGIADGLSAKEIVPYYLISFLGLYLYFSITSMIDIPGKKDILKITLIDFFENRMVNRLNFNMTDVIAQKEWNPIAGRSQDQIPILEGKEREEELQTIVKLNGEETLEGIVEEKTSLTKEEELALLINELFA